MERIWPRADIEEVRMHARRTMREVMHGIARSPDSPQRGRGDMSGTKKNTRVDLAEQAGRAAEGDRKDHVPRRGKPSSAAGPSSTVNSSACEWRWERRGGSPMTAPPVDIDTRREESHGARTMESSTARDLTHINGRTILVAEGDSQCRVASSSPPEPRRLPGFRGTTTLHRHSRSSSPRRRTW